MTWDTLLTESVALSSGRQRFKTLRDAATFLAARYDRARGGGLEGAIRDLMAAAENPTEDAVGRATRQFARFHADIPHQEVVFLDEADDKANPMKAKGVGELGLCGVGAAIANALYNATGVRVRDYPITLDTYFERLAVPGQDIV